MSVEQNGYVLATLTEGHDLSTFTSGEPSLDDWLCRSALLAQSKGTARTTVMHRGDSRVLGYFSLTPHSIDSAALPRSLSRGDPRRVPAFLLARLAVHAELQGQGLGGDLLVAAMEKSLGAAEAVGGRYLVVDALTPAAAGFYRSRGFKDTSDIGGGHARLARKMTDIAGEIRQRRTLRTGEPVGPVAPSDQPRAAGAPDSERLQLLVYHALNALPAAAAARCIALTLQVVSTPNVPLPGGERNGMEQLT